MTYESELSRAKAECDRAFHDFMEANILLTGPNCSKTEAENAKHEFFKALHSFNEAFEKYGHIQNPAL